MATPDNHDNPLCPGSSYRGRMLPFTRQYGCMLQTGAPSLDLKVKRLNNLVYPVVRGQRNLVYRDNATGSDTPTHFELIKWFPPRHQHVPVIATVVWMCGWQEYQMAMKDKV